jgi:branched-chain amino acid transport system substrate-binding protein
MYLGTVHNGAITYRVQTMEKKPAQSAATLPVAGPVPYARVGEEGVSYAGPKQPDVPPGPVRVVLFGPHADAVAHAPELQTLLSASLTNGMPWELLPVASDQNWGAASTQLVHALWDEHALAIIALDRDAAHLSEQLALKAFVPVLALSDDKALTSTNIPWIFRLPARTPPAKALALLVQAAARSGTNPERLRETLASGDPYSGVAFLSTGEPKAK